LLIKGTSFFIQSNRTIWKFDLLHFNIDIEGLTVDLQFAWSSPSKAIVQRLYPICRYPVCHAASRPV